ncbi:hypothetical protein JW752_04060 [Candidatus Peregrinibacteria bacterium]|nr:hypothetical protein [Candidatus Peregrinibacteria bacterium]
MTEKKKQSAPETTEQALNSPRKQIEQALTGTEPERNTDEELETAIDRNEAKEKILKKLGVKREGLQTDDSIVEFGTGSDKDKASKPAKMMIKMILGEDTVIEDDDIEYIQILGGDIMAGAHGKKIPTEPKKTTK